MRSSRAARQLVRCFSSRSLSAENDIYKTAAGTPPSILGNVITAMLEGKGRGVIARHSVGAGDLLMCVRPAVVIEGPPDQAPDPSLLIPGLVQAANAVDVPEIAAAMKHLYDGTEGSRHSLPNLHQMMQRPQQAHSHGGSSSSSSCCDHHDHHGHHHHHHHDEHDHHDHHAAPHNNSSSSSSSKPEQMKDHQAALIIKYNAFGDDYEDLAAAAVRGAAVPHSHVGLWPQFAMFNHACLPNAVHYNVGHAMVVRAVEDTPAGEELTVSYLGREEFAPAAARQAVLRERFGFACSCARCALEQQAPQRLQRSLESLYASVMKDIRPQFLDAVEKQDFSQLALVFNQLQQHEDRLSQQLQDHISTLSDSAILVLQAAVYDLFELLLFCEHLVGGGNGSGKMHNILSRLGRCLAVLNCVSRGAELHVYMASRLLQHAINLQGNDSAQAKAAAQLFLEAFKLRYGCQLEHGLQMQLMKANKQVAEEFLM